MDSRPIQRAERTHSDQHVGLALVALLTVTVLFARAGANVCQGRHWQVTDRVVDQTMQPIALVRSSRQAVLTDDR